MKHFDETGLQVAKKLHWLHCACGSNYRVYSVQPKRGSEGMDAMGILPAADGFAVHDFWGSYLKYGNVKHAMCGAHLERELVYVNETGGQKWAASLRAFLQKLCHLKNQRIAEGETSFSPEELRGFSRQYDAIVQCGLQANPLQQETIGKRGRPKKGKIRCLLERFQSYKPEILRFATDWHVPFTNNTAERAIRCARVREKVSGCFRTKAGADGFATTLSYVASAFFHGFSCYEALLSAF